ncbi:threonine ammonia-lyase [Skeletonema marinoi]|uniref:Threonine dehydratase n=1 Tax=Skeletonema marinoi TaxID=267567 RepID=A0AAD8YEM7_9STRA|nr:threonine ammonia-lyase [Skeletonema marinoi]
MWRFPSNYQRVVMSTARRLSSHTSVAPLTSCNPLSSSNIVGGNTTDVSGPCRRYVSSSVNRSNNHHAAYAPTATLKNTNRCKSTAIIPPEEEPAMGESLDESGYLGMILNAKVYDAAIETELQHAKSMSLLLNNTVYLKREDTQPVFSFKIRGAYNKMASLSEEALACGVVACSAGNHAQGVALSARMLGCRAVICMPLATPSIKVHAVRAHGGDTVEVRLFGNNYDEAAAEAKRLMKEENLSMIHPFDDPEVIAGQGTIALEILKKCVSHPVDAIFVCCGGGGMLAGIAAYVKQVRPSVKVYGVEASDAAGMTASLAAGKVVTLPSVGLFADGAAVRTIGSETFRVCEKYVDGMVTVDTDQLCNAIKLAYNDARVILEPAGALAVAGLKKFTEENNITGRTFVAITSGANMDFNRLRVVSERADDSERTVQITIPETPGSFRLMYSKIWPRNVTEFSYRYECGQEANVFLSFQPLPNVEGDYEQVIQSLESENFPCNDLSHNELAKTHIRHLAGGRSGATHERLFRFHFPESPGALQRFLDSLNMKWNISLFHYRNYGDDFGRCLVGIQQNHGMKCEGMNQFLKDLGYEYVEETNNSAYTKFLRNKEG